MATEEFDKREEARSLLRQDFERTLDAQVDRQLRVEVHPIIGDEFFSVASTECKKMFVAGHYYGCITLCQSLAEGLARFVIKRNGNQGSGFEKNLRRIRNNEWLSAASLAALQQVHGEDRDDFHHLNPELEQDRRQLELRAEECLQAIFVVESEIFAYDFGSTPETAGMIVPRQRRYWNFEGNGNVATYVRFQS